MQAQEKLYTSVYFYCHPLMKMADLAATESLGMIDNKSDIILLVTQIFFIDKHASMCVSQNILAFLTLSQIGKMCVCP